ncbi:MAG: PDZ domain-containing protein, partial [Puniceicoccales bacterium]|nr:PDZ domain-containing protein [Puniceicoccales bacterium]
MGWVREQMGRWRFFLPGLFLWYGILTGSEDPKTAVPAGEEGSEVPAFKKLVPTPEMRTETIYLVRFLEELHYRKLDHLDGKKVLEGFLEDLDVNRMILSKNDIDETVKRYSDSIEILLKAGSLGPACEIFEDYRIKAIKRLEWVETRLQKPFTFDETNENFGPDRREAPWPNDEKTFDELWESRLRYEITNEMLAGHSKDRTPSADLPKEGEKKEEFKNLPPTPEEALKNLPEATRTVGERYRGIRDFLGRVDETDVQEIFLNALCRLYDPHTQFLSPESREEFSIVLSNSLVGIGAYLREENGDCYVVQLLPGGPAEASKQIKPGDKILTVQQEGSDPVDICGKKLRQSVKLIRGPKGSKVTLTLQPVDGNPSDRRKVTLVRDEVKLTDNLASAKLYTFKNENGVTQRIGYIELSSFYGDEESPHNATDDVKTLLKELKRRGMEALIFDLRRNGGGLLMEAIRLTGVFLENCPVVQSKDASPKVEIHFIKDEEVEWSGPTLMLVSRFSASAAEILPGALKNHRRVLVVGDSHTHGKGSVQVLIDLDRCSLLPRKEPHLGSVKLTVQKWYLPDGNSTQQKGVESDIPLPSFNEVLPIGESDMPN